MDVTKQQEKTKLCCADCRKPVSDDHNSLDDALCQCNAEPMTEIILKTASSDGMDGKNQDQAAMGKSSASSDESHVTLGQGQATLAETDAVPSDGCGLSTTDAKVDDLGENFEILGELGSGGMGRVYRVRDRTRGKVLALKMLKPECSGDELALKRFGNEIEAVSQLTHPNLVGIYEHGVSPSGAPYFVMDCIEGTSLAEILAEERKLSSERALRLFVQICQALAHAHMKGVVHRDLKPSNILITRDKIGAEQVKIVDFGVAKLFPNAEFRETQNLTKTGDVLGTPLYMSPEQCMGLKTDERSDVYSLGCLMYEALSGTPPYTGENPIQIIAQHLNDAAENFAISCDPQVLKELEAISKKAMSKAPDDRYQSMDLMLLDLVKAQDGRKNIAAKVSLARNAGVRLVFSVLVSITLTVVGLGLMMLPALSVIFQALGPLMNGTANSTVSTVASNIYPYAIQTRENLDQFAKTRSQENARDYITDLSALEYSLQLFKDLPAGDSESESSKRRVIQVTTQEVYSFRGRWAELLNDKSIQSAESIAKFDAKVASAEEFLKSLAKKGESPAKPEFNNWLSGSAFWCWEGAVGSIFAILLFRAVMWMHDMANEEKYERQRQLDRSGARAERARSSL